MEWLFFIPFVTEKWSGGWFAEAFLRDKDAAGPEEKIGAYYWGVVCRNH